MKDKKLIMTVRRGFYITKEEYLSFISDIYKFFKREDVLLYNKPLKVIRSKGILIRMGKGVGKYRSHIIKFNKNMNIVTLSFNHNDFNYVAHVLVKYFVKRYKFYGLDIIIMNHF